MPKTVCGGRESAYLSKKPTSIRKTGIQNRNDYSSETQTGEWVSIHWGYVCDVLTERQRNNLERYTPVCTCSEQTHMKIYSVGNTLVKRRSSSLLLLPKLQLEFPDIEFEKPILMKILFEAGHHHRYSTGN